MAALGYGWGATQTGISLTGASFLTTIANTATGISAAFTIAALSTAAGATPVLANLQLNITSATPAAGAPNIQGVFLVKDDGTNYDTYGVSNSQLFPIDMTSFTSQLQPSVATTIIKVKGIVLPFVPSAGTNVEFVIYNLSGVSITINSADLYPAGYDAG